MSESASKSATGRCVPTAPGYFFTWKGKEYFLPRQGPGDRDKFHALANALAIADVRAMAEHVATGVITQEEYLSAWDATQTRVSSGYYAYAEPGGVERRLTTSGVAALCWLSIRRENPAVTFAEIRAIADEDPALLTDAFVRANETPKRETPAADPPDGPPPTDEGVKAWLAQECGLSPAEIDKLSDKQINELYGRPHPWKKPADDDKEWQPAFVGVIDQMRARGMTTEEIKAKLAADRDQRQAPKDRVGVLPAGVRADGV